MGIRNDHKGRLMTIEEAIQALKKEKRTALHENKVAFDMAIKALEQEPTADNDSAVDTNKLLETCEKMSFDFELFGRPTKALLLDAVKNIVNDLLRATPQEPKPMVEIDLYSVIKQKYIEREVLDKIRADIISYEGDCRLSVDEYPSCKQCTDNVFETIYGILDKHKGESEEENGT